MRAVNRTVNAGETNEKMKLLSGLLRQAKRRADERETARDLYIAAVAQARRPGFYTKCGVADSIDGRFDLIVLHVFLTVRVLGTAGEAGKRLADYMFRIMMDDMDLNLREMGVSDLRVGKRVKSMARAFYGRAAAYEKAIEADGAAEGEGEELKAALERNIYGAETPSPEQIAGLLAYVRRAESTLAELSDEALLTGRVSFPTAPGDESAGNEAKI